MNRQFKTVAVLALIMFISDPVAEAAEPSVVTGRWVVLRDEQASGPEQLAAREIRRFIYLRTGRLLPLATADAVETRRGDAIVVGTLDRPVVRAWTTAIQPGPAPAALKPQQYRVKTVTATDTRRQALVVTGGDPVGVLYGAYQFLEQLGVRFYLHGDGVPDAPWTPTKVGVATGAGTCRAGRGLALPAVDLEGQPLFELRGIQPFHDFPEGPDWWDRDHYLAILGQLPKLRMNFFGLHTYPEGRPNAEPTVWIGLPGDVGEGEAVKFSYPSSYQNTLRGNWGYSARKTGDFLFGADRLFDRDAFGAADMMGFYPEPARAADANELFFRTGRLLREVFAFARFLGIRTCIGTETPLVIPQAVQDRLRSLGRNPQDLAVIEELYTGMFERITKTHPLDYFWFWTPEGWTWEGTKDEQVRAATNDLQAAINAARKTKASFKLATCGWVLGPQQDRALFDKLLPKNIAVSCINREVGKTPVDAAFSKVSGRSKWAIPWLEDDPALTSPQLWVGRMRRDAADAYRYGCDGLMGIHWRTRILGPATLALARAAWDQAPWNRPLEPSIAPPPAEGATGGRHAAFPNRDISDTDEDEIYQTVRWDVSAYRLKLANGGYHVTLKFCEPHHTGPGKRVFDVSIQGRNVLPDLDIFARVGQNKAIDFNFENVQVTNGWLEIGFVPRVEFPAIAGMVVTGPDGTRKINCGGPALRDYTADWPAAPEAKPVFPDTTDFYCDWARQEFGPEVARDAARIFTKIDGALPRPSDWVDGPGGIRPDSRSWIIASKDYGFVEEFAALQPKVRSAGNRERFDYWLNNFQYMRAMAQLNCLWGEFNQTMAEIKKEPDPQRKRALAREWALPIRIRMIQNLARIYEHLLATLTNTSELGTVANWEQHLLPEVLTKPGWELARELGEPLPPEAQPSQDYHGPMRILVPAVRTSVIAGEQTQLKVILLAGESPRQAVFYWRPLGLGTFRPVALDHAGRGVYTTPLPCADAQANDFEYYLKVTPARGKAVVWPATAPKLNQTVVVLLQM